MGPKKNAQKMSLGDFLTDKSLGSWADEMEDLPTVPSTGGDSRSGYGNRRDDYGGDNDRGFGSRSYGGDRDYQPRTQLPVPDKPPFTAHIGNLSFDANEADLENFFAECEVSNIRLVRDRMDDRPKGFGYVEFKSAAGLIKALDLSGRPLAGRDVRVSVAEAPKDHGSSERVLGDWKRSGPLPPLEREHSSGYRRAGGDRGFGGDRNFGGSEAGDRPERPERRGTGFGDDGRVRNLDSWERKGPLPTPTAPSFVDRPHSRDREPRRQQSPSEGGGFQTRRTFQERPAVERQPTAAEKDNEWRRGARPDPPAAPSVKSGPASPVIPHTRPRLELKKRSENADAIVSPSADSKSSPFGAARPTDTAAKLREIEEKLAAQKLEAKAERERRAKAAAEEKEKERAAPRGRNFDMLRRGSAAPSAADEEEAAKSASGSQAGGEKTEPAAAVASPAAVEPAAVDEEGWSQVVKPSKRRGGANGK